MTTLEEFAELRVLVADDDPIVREATGGALRAMGVEAVELAIDGREAVSLIADHGERIDMLLLDILMPDMDGLEVLFELSRRRFGGRVGFITSATHPLRDSAEIYAKHSGLRYAGTLEKPIGRAELGEMILS